jgi:hypothetical protein
MRTRCKMRCTLKAATASQIIENQCWRQGKHYSPTDDDALAAGPEDPNHHRRRLGENRGNDNLSVISRGHADKQLSRNGVTEPERIVGNRC